MSLLTIIIQNISLIAQGLGLLGLILLASKFISKKRKKLRKKDSDSTPYVAQKYLFTPSEQRFLRILDQSLAHDYLIFGKVRIADLLKTKYGLKKHEKRIAFNKISAKHVDFVICDAKSLSCLGVIELDDRSHLLPARQQRDRFVDAAFQSAGIPILHIPVQRYYRIAELQAKLERAFFSKK